MDAETATRLVGVLTLIPSLLREYGVDPAPVLARAGLAGDALDDPAGRVDYEALMRLLNEAAGAAERPDFGLQLGCAWKIADTGPLAGLLRHSPTVGQGLSEFIVHHHLVTEAALPFLQVHGASADLGYALYLPMRASPSPYYDAVLAAGVNLLRELCGPAWSPSAVLLAHAPPAELEPYRRHFRAPIRFNSEINALRFPASCLDLPIPGADARSLRLARATVYAASQPTFVQQVHRTLRVLMLHGQHSGTDVAQALAMHRRTLIRRLNAEGTTFQEVIDHVRSAVAMELLRDSAVSLQDIAACLGYAGVPPFIRAFQRWTGTTPGAWRKLACGRPTDAAPHA